ncbi:MAG TPA: sulfurtransferase [Burkholderiales bacterium]
MSAAVLIDGATLAARLGDAGVRIFDCRHDLAKPALGAQQYAQAHLPGALHAHMDHDLARHGDVSNGRHPLPTPEAFAAWLGRQGVRPEDHVVAYDAGGGTSAARLWWMLRWMGHAKVSVLDGGIAAWVAEGRPVTAEVAAFPKSAYPVAPRAALAVDVGTVESHLRDGSMLILDARAAARFRGESEPIDPVAGRIPGSRNRFCGENLDGGRFKPAAQLRKEFEAVLDGTPPSQVVHSCGSGVAACHNALAMEIAGLPGSRVYPGSWSEWIADPGRPRETG